MSDPKVGDKLRLKDNLLVEYPHYPKETTIVKVEYVNNNVLIHHEKYGFDINLTKTMYNKVYDNLTTPTHSQFLAKYKGVKIDTHKVIVLSTSWNCMPKGTVMDIRELPTHDLDFNCYFLVNAPETLLRAEFDKWIKREDTFDFDFTLNRFHYGNMEDIERGVIDIVPNDSLTLTIYGD